FPAVHRIAINKPATTQEEDPPLVAELELPSSKIQEHLNTASSTRNQKQWLQLRAQLQPLPLLWVPPAIHNCLPERKDRGEDEVEDEVVEEVATTMMDAIQIQLTRLTPVAVDVVEVEVAATAMGQQPTTPSQFVVFTDDANKKYEEYSDADIVSTDANIGIRYEKTEIVEDTVLLLRYNCPDGDCDVACLGWPDLHR
ncbi:hypothetical protein DH86_00000941, partial [Scytalidium sp. 3C]